MTDSGHHDPPAIEELAASGDVNALIEALKDPDSAVRRAAAKALGVLGDKRAIKPLRGVLYDEDERVRLLAFEALYQLIPITDHHGLIGTRLTLARLGVLPFRSIEAWRQWLKQFGL